MKRVATALSFLISLAFPVTIAAEKMEPTEPSVDIVRVTTADMHLNDAPPRVVMHVDSDQYNAIIKLVSDSGHASGKSNVRAYDYTDSLRYVHNVLVTYMPKNVSWKDPSSRPMQIDVFVSGPASFTYAVAEMGNVAYDCRCSDSTPESIRNRFDNIIRFAINNMVNLGKRGTRLSSTSGL